MKAKEQSNLFNENYQGLLSHDGSIRVAKTEIKQKILHIGTDTVLVKGRKSSYHAQIHKNLQDYLVFVDVGDFAYIKWKMGKPYFVGFQKKKSANSNGVSIESTESLNRFMQGVDVE